MTEHFVFSGSFDTASMTPEQKAVFIAEVEKLITESLTFVSKYGRDSEYGPIEAYVHNMKVTVA